MIAIKHGRRRELLLELVSSSFTWATASPTTIATLKEWAADTQVAETEREKSADEYMTKHLPLSGAPNELAEQWFKTKPQYLAPYLQEIVRLVALHVTFAAEEANPPLERDITRLPAIILYGSTEELINAHYKTYQESITKILELLEEARNKQSDRAQPKALELTDNATTQVQKIGRHIAEVKLRQSGLSRKQVR